MKALINGKIYGKDGMYEAILINGNRIEKIGTDEDIKAELTSEDICVDLNGKLVLPGFVDSHAHGPLSLSQITGRIDLLNAETKEEYFDIIIAFVANHPDKAVYSGTGWLNPEFESIGPDKESLDEICSDRPMILRSGDGHSVWANSKAVELAGITANTPDPEGGTIEKNSDGTVRGTFRDQAQEALLALIPEPSVAEYKEAIEVYQNMMASYGHTAVFDPMVDIDGNMHKAYREMSDSGDLKIKCGLAYTSNPDNPMDALQAYKKEEKVRRNRLIEGNFIKVFIDGVVEGGTAYLKEDYCNRKGYKGESLWKQETLNKFAAAVDKAGYDLHFHVIGDAAAAQLIEAMEYVRDNNGERPRNTVAAHMQIVDTADYDKLKELDIRISSNPYWFFKAPGYYENIEFPFLGERAETEYPMRSFFDAGMTVSAGSDYAVTPEPYPMVGIQMAVLRALADADHMDPDQVLNASERITLEQGIEAFTINGAKTMGIDDITGSIEPGKRADLVVMEQNVFDVEPSEYHKIAVFMTISDGEVVYEK